MLPLRRQSGSGSYGNDGVLRIPQNSNNTGTSSSDCLASYLGHSCVCVGGGLSLQRTEQQGE